MKTMTCKQLGGACDMEFQADTFDEMASLSRQHGMEMFQNGDAAHAEAMQKMAAMMQQPGALQKWMEEKEREFDAL
ncbi:MAG: DUF1059 domain-containing protein [Fluviicola sp. XM-24bin1]|nr:MAG: DUF1059 domain-containing protein [Fluviicola sp. XM-24bin1]